MFTIELGQLPQSGTSRQRYDRPHRISNGTYSWLQRSMLVTGVLKNITGIDAGILKESLFVYPTPRDSHFPTAPAPLRVSSERTGRLAPPKTRNRTFDVLIKTGHLDLLPTPKLPTESGWFSPGPSKIRVTADVRDERRITAGCLRRATPSASGKSTRLQDGQVDRAIELY